MENIVSTQEKRCYTVKELQEILGISRPTVYELLKRTNSAGSRLGQSIVFLRRALMNGWIRKLKNVSYLLNDRKTCVLYCERKEVCRWML